MRYEHIVLDISTAGCAALEAALGFAGAAIIADFGEQACAEVLNLQNELRARLQRRDADPHSPKNAAPVEEDWLA